ncbi:hypothetical protein CATRI_06570 [Corynebacterium atrinae]|nr:hypothetical protein CATRI_06570 [Corynebacterium atrinae]
MVHLAPLLILINSACVTFWAAREARKQSPAHPFVTHHSPTSSTWFYASSFFYAGSLVSLLALFTTTSDIVVNQNQRDH